MKLYNFKIEEFACPCCGANKMQNSTMIALDLARDILKEPIILNSAYRCERHNKEVSGSITSSHLTGYAADIQVKSSGYRYEILTALRNVGFNRFGIYSTFVHVDSDPNKTKNVTWCK